MDDIADIAIEVATAVQHLRAAQTKTNDAKLAIIRAERKLGPSKYSNELLSYIKQLEGLMAEQSNCATCMEATYALLVGVDEPDVEIVEGR